MSLAIVTFANIGKKKNLKTADIQPVITTFTKRGALGQVICQIAEGAIEPQIVPAVPTLVRYATRLFELITRRALSRNWHESVFDFFAGLRLKPATVVLFHPALFMRTLRRAKQQGSITVGIAAAVHPQFAAAEYARECSLLGLPPHPYPEAVPHKLVADDFDYIVALSEFAKETFMQQGTPPDRIRVALPDIDTNRFSPVVREDSVFRVVYAGYTTPLKGLHYLLDAWEQISLPENAELVLIGGYGDMPESLRVAYTERIARDTRITMVPSTQSPEEWYRKASVFVFPSLVEGFGRVTLEAMACGVPVITTDRARGIVADGETGYIVPSRDAHAIAEKLTFLHEHPDTAVAMGKAARAAVLAKTPFGEAVYDFYTSITATV